MSPGFLHINIDKKQKDKLFQVQTLAKVMTPALQKSRDAQSGGTLHEYEQRNATAE